MIMTPGGWAVGMTLVDGEITATHLGEIPPARGVMKGTTGRWAVGMTLKTEDIAMIIVGVTLCIDTF